MEKTGIGLLEIFGLVAILLPLVPVFIIVVLKTYKHDVLALLAILCLISFIQNLILYIPKFAVTDLIFIKATFQLVNFIILFIILETVIANKSLRKGMKMFLVSFVSVVLTTYSLQGISKYSGNIELAQGVLIIIVAVIALLQLIRIHDIFIFFSPMFWIATGTFFYYSMLLLTQSLPEYNSVISGTLQQQKKILLLIIILIQFGFYIIAASVAGIKNKENKMTMY